jgi:hypothetical protein
MPSAVYVLAGRKSRFDLRGKSEFKLYFHDTHVKEKNATSGIFPKKSPILLYDQELAKFCFLLKIP